MARGGSQPSCPAIAPVIAILRMLKARGELSGQRPIFANKREADFILREELEAMDGLEVIHVLSQEDKSGFEHGRVDKPMLERLIGATGQHFYVCGPEPMIESVNDALKQLDADPDALVFEE